LLRGQQPFERSRSHYSDTASAGKVHNPCDLKK
jgi:hypothetical protein